MKVAILFDNFGPYHLARLRAAASVAELLAGEVAATSAEYAWKSRDKGAAKAEIGCNGCEATAGLSNQKMEIENEFQSEAFQVVTLQETGTSPEALRNELSRKVVEVLEQ